MPLSLIIFSAEQYEMPETSISLMRQKPKNHTAKRITAAMKMSHSRRWVFRRRVISGVLFLFVIFLSSLCEA